MSIFEPLYYQNHAQFLTICLRMETQNLVISFDYSWFLAKNLAYAKCIIMKLHYRNSSNEGHWQYWEQRHSTTETHLALIAN